MFKNIDNKKPKNLPQKDQLKKKPDEKTKKIYGTLLDVHHPWRKINTNKKINIEKIFIKKSKKKI